MERIWDGAGRVAADRARGSPERVSAVAPASAAEPALHAGEPSRSATDGSPSADKRPIILHAHCHQKALWGAETSARLLRRIAGPRLTVLESGCCGMAGSFGYTEDKYHLSMAIGEQSVFPPIRAATDDALVCAPGTSCRHQIHDGTGRWALHPIEVAADVLGV
ncbi:MAG: hypothetical protein U0575_02740 [Phycisphaerales bacterium]